HLALEALGVGDPPLHQDVAQLLHLEGVPTLGGQGLAVVALGGGAALLGDVALGLLVEARDVVVERLAALDLVVLALAVEDFEVVGVLLPDLFELLAMLAL